VGRDAPARDAEVSFESASARRFLVEVRPPAALVPFMGELSLRAFASNVATIAPLRDVHERF